MATKVLLLLTALIAVVAGVYILCELPTFSYLWSLPLALCLSSFGAFLGKTKCPKAEFPLYLVSFILLLVFVYALFFKHI